MLNPIILNIDSSVNLPEEIASLDFRSWQETLRFASRWRQFNEFFLKFTRIIEAKNHCGPKLFFLGSGDFHHLSYGLIRMLSNLQQIHLVIFDNHPDNMIYLKGIHCGSWVYHASLLPFVKRISVIGICSSDIAGFSFLQNRLSQLRSGKIKYYAFRKAAFLSSFMCPNAIVDARETLFNNPQEFIKDLIKDRMPIYLSIDKDVLSRDVLLTNWDQGILGKEMLFQCVETLNPLVVGADITGEISNYAYKSLYKRMLSYIDGQRTISKEKIALAQHSQIALNKEIIKILCSKLLKE